MATSGKAHEVSEMYDRLLRGVALDSSDAGIRIRAEYAPAGGPGSKVSPPTYPLQGDAVYVFEERRDEAGELHTVVRLDGEASQANRCEEALQDAIDEGLSSLPYIELADEIEGTRVRVTNLQAPHRFPDAYFRDSQTDDGTPFDRSPEGGALIESDQRTARALYRFVPSDLAFGVWNSHRGGRGLQLARAYTSEIIGWDAQAGTRASVRTDPLNVPKSIGIAASETDRTDWHVTVDGKSTKGYKAKRPSEIGYGSVPAEAKAGGVDVSRAERIGFLSFAALARLRFPEDGQRADPAVDAAGRAAIAALAMYADRLAFAGPSVFLRSGCDLVLVEERIGWVGRGAVVESFDLDRAAAKALFDHAVERAAKVGLTWGDPISLVPQENQRQLISLALKSVVGADER